MFVSNENRFQVIKYVLSNLAVYLCLVEIDSKMKRNSEQVKAAGGEGSSLRFN